MKKLPAMQTGTKNEVTLQKSAGFAEEIENVGHRSIWMLREDEQATLLLRVDQFSSVRPVPSSLAALTKERPLPCRSRNSSARAR